MAAQAVLLGFVFLLAVAVWKDVTSFTIPNWVAAAVAALFPLAALAGGLGWGESGLHLAIGLGALALGMALWAPGWIGGGDAKLFAALALWFGWPDVLSYLFMTVLAGGGLALFLLTVRRYAPGVRLPASWLTNSPLVEGAPAPYAVALAAGALIALPRTPFFAAVTG